jgi:hypothetical protein
LNEIQPLRLRQEEELCNEIFQFKDFKPDCYYAVETDAEPTGRGFVSFADYCQLLKFDEELAEIRFKTFLIFFLFRTGPYPPFSWKILLICACIQCLHSNFNILTLPCSMYLRSQH